MKNITLSIDDETYRRVRIAAAERSTTVSAMVREYLRSVARPGDDARSAADELFSILDRARGFRATDRLTREEAHGR